MTRTITVYNSVTQEKKVLRNVEADTLADLKHLFDQNGISYSDMDFMEGVSQTKLISDSSVLPHDIPFRGQVTNDLLIYMTLKDKKVRSGIDVDAFDRRGLLIFIKDNGWADAINALFGENYTRISSAELKEFCKSKLAQQPKEAGCKCVNLVPAFRALVKELENEGCITPDAADAILDLVDNAPVQEEGGFSMADIESMMPVLD